MATNTQVGGRKKVQPPNQTAVLRKVAALWTRPRRISDKDPSAPSGVFASSVPPQAQPRSHCSGKTASPEAPMRRPDRQPRARQPTTAATATTGNAVSFSRGPTAASKANSFVLIASRRLRAATIKTAQAKTATSLLTRINDSAAPGSSRASSKRVSKCAFPLPSLLIGKQRTHPTSSTAARRSRRICDSGAVPIAGAKSPSTEAAAR